MGNKSDRLRGAESVKPFYKVIILQIDTFQSVIADERHFGTLEEATIFSENAKRGGYVGVIIRIGE